MLRKIFSFLALVALTVLLGVPAFIIGAFRRRSEMTSRLGRLWSRGMLAAVGARVEFLGLEHATGDAPCVFIANHQSNVDIWVLLRVLPLRTRFVAKQSLFRFPVLGWAMTVAGFIPIDRKNVGRAVQSLGLAVHRIREGDSVILFAEGTRSRDGRLQEFKKGPFHLALQAGVPIVPVAISGSWQVLPPGTWRVTPGPVRARFLPPMDVAPYLPKDVQGLRAAVHSALREALEELRSGDDDAAPAGVG
jgi:1-acyl-sn-glycerol-3-phosphate acyltransferase